MRRYRVLIFAAVLLFSAGCDHAAKHVAEGVLGGAPAVSIAGDAVRFELAYNPGGFLSVGARLPLELRRFLFLAGVPLVLALVCVLALRSEIAAGWNVVSLGLVAGGGIANWLDRVLHAGVVTDFVSVGVGPLRTGVFNLADVSVVAGVGLLLLAARARARPATA